MKEINDFEEGGEFRIVVKNVVKLFEKNYKKKEGLLFRILSLGSKNERKKKKVLKNISFKLKPGKNLGIVGRNGSGKSTLLRVIAGIYQPDSGIVYTNGGLVYLTGFGQGLKPKLKIGRAHV